MRARALRLETELDWWLSDRSLQAKPANRVSLDHGQADLVAEQIPNVIDAVQDHGGPAQGVCDKFHGGLGAICRA